MVLAMASKAAPLMEMRIMRGQYRPGSGRPQNLARAPRAFPAAQAVAGGLIGLGRVPGPTSGACGVSLGVFGWHFPDGLALGRHASFQQN